MSEPRQLVLDLPHRTALGAEDYLVSDANAAAVALVDRWPDWPQQAIIVVGPPRSGKSHLAHVWQRKSGAAEPIAARDLNEQAVNVFAATGALVIEDVDLGVADEQSLFHLLNLAREHRRYLLLTSAVAPGDIAVSLPDLRSRLRALPVGKIEMPDEALLEAVLVKLFQDRQLMVEPHVIGHLARNMDRSFSAATEAVCEIDRRALAAKRRVTRALASQVLVALGAAAGDGEAA